MLRILDAAEAVIAEEGHSRATTRRIAAEAGVDKRVLAYYFESREALLAEVVGRTAGRVAATIEHELAAVPAAERSEARLLTAVWEGICSEPALVKAYVVILASDETGVREVVDGMTRDYTDLLRRELVALGQAPEAAEDVAPAMTAMVRGLLLSWTEGESQSSIRTTIAAVGRRIRR
ncbi:TetR/AcrR family transcriptional regulator [Paraconexibacter algicola]|nr:TetR/AcrR family transcriptional regulator [Paraconexibacter algicola]